MFKIKKKLFFMFELKQKSQKEVKLNALCVWEKIKQKYRSEMMC